MEHSSSEDEDNGLIFWNNWFPHEGNWSIQNRIRNRSTTNFVSSYFKSKSVSSVIKNFNCGSWIPPLDSPNISKLKKLKRNNEASEKYFFQTKKWSRTPTSETTGTEVKENYDCSNPCKKEINIVWKEKIQLHDVTKFRDGDLIWGCVNVGVFANIRLWVNEYGNICGSAEGTISKLGSTEMSFISIKDAELLQKMLNLSGSQWTSLLEIVKENKLCLKFDAFEDCKLTRKSSLEKLWFFICKRRHFLPNQFMLVKLCGAIKCLRKFQITPKLVVKEIKIHLDNHATRNI